MSLTRKAERRLRRFRVAYYDNPSRRRWMAVRAHTVGEAKRRVLEAHPTAYIFGVVEV